MIQKISMLINAVLLNMNNQANKLTIQTINQIGVL